jgi:hypothetical protein
MPEFVLLDSGPLGLACRRHGLPLPDRCRQWFRELIARGVGVIVPEIAEYEVRRELTRIGAGTSLKRLDDLVRALNGWTGYGRDGTGRSAEGAGRSVVGDVPLKSRAVDRDDGGSRRAPRYGRCTPGLMRHDGRWCPLVRWPGNWGTALKSLLRPPHRRSRRLISLGMTGSWYGFLFSIPGQSERLRQMQRGVVQRQAMHGSPQVQHIAPHPAFIMKASENVLAQID